MNEDVFGKDPVHIVYVRDKSENITPSLYSGGYVLARYDIHRDDSRWHVYSCFADTEKDAVLSANDPERGRIELFDRGYYVEHVLDAGAATVAPADRIVFGLFHSFDYFHHCGLDPFRALANDVGRDYEIVLANKVLGDSTSLPQLPSYLEEHAGEYRMNSTPVTVDGAKCLVLEWPQMDKMWVDPALNYAIRRRVYHWEEGGPRKLDIRNQDFKEVKPGLFLPMKQTVLKFANMPSEREAIWDKVTAEIGLSVQEVSFDQKLDLANFELPAGVMVNDTIRKENYRVPEEGEKSFERPILEAVQLKMNPSRSAWLPWILCGSMFFILLAVYLFRRRRMAI